jgi:hypothetical protein
VLDAEIFHTPVEGRLELSRPFRRRRRAESAALGVAGAVAHLALVSKTRRPAGAGARAPTSASLFDQGLSQILQASVTGLEPKTPYVLALETRPDGSGALEALAAYTTNPAGSAIVNAVGPIRQVVRGEDQAPRRYLVIGPGTAGDVGAPVPVQLLEPARR